MGRIFVLLQDKTLVGEESNEDFARRMFASFDKEGEREVNAVLVIADLYSTAT